MTRDEKKITVSTHLELLNNNYLTRSSFQILLGAAIFLFIDFFIHIFKRLLLLLYLFTRNYWYIGKNKRKHSNDKKVRKQIRIKEGFKLRGWQLPYPALLRTPLRVTNLISKKFIFEPLGL